MCPGLWGVLVCVAVGVVPRWGPVCACAVSLGAPWLCPFCVCCCLSRCGVVVCFLFCQVLCGVPVLGLVLAPRCCPLLPFPGPLSWPVVVFCPGVRCCGALVCRLSSGVLLWCRVVSFALASAVWCCLSLPADHCFVWLLDVVSRWRVLSWIVLPGRVACCPAVCCGLLWCPAPLCCVLCSVVLRCRVVPCPGVLLSILLCWWCWFVSFPCVCGAVLCCMSCCSVPVWFALLLVPRAVLCRCVLWCLPGLSAGWWCCSGVVSCCVVRCPVVSCALCCVLRCCAALSCCAGWLCFAVLCAAGVCFSFCPLNFC